MANGALGALDVVAGLASKKLAGFVLAMGMVWQIEIDTSSALAFYGALAKIAAITVLGLSYGILQWVIDRRSQVAEEAAEVVRGIRESTGATGI